MSSLTPQTPQVVFESQSLVRVPDGMNADDLALFLVTRPIVNDIPGLLALDANFLDLLGRLRTDYAVKDEIDPRSLATLSYALERFAFAHLITVPNSAFVADDTDSEGDAGSLYSVEELPRTLSTPVEEKDNKDAFVPFECWFLGDRRRARFNGPAWHDDDDGKSLEDLRKMTAHHRDQNGNLLPYDVVFPKGNHEEDSKVNHDDKAHQAPTWAQRMFNNALEAGMNLANRHIWSQANGHILPCFDNLKEKNFVTEFTKYEPWIDFVKQSVILISQLYRSRDAADVYFSVYQFLSIFSDAMVDKAVASALAASISSAFRKDPDVEVESWSSDIRDIAATMKNIVGAPVAVAIQDLLVTAASYKLFNQNFAFLIYDHIRRPTKCSVFELMELVLNAIATLVGVGEAVAKGMPLHEALFASDPVQAALSRCRYLLTMQDFLFDGLPVEGYINLTDWMVEAQSVHAVLVDAQKRLSHYASNRDTIEKNALALMEAMNGKRLLFSSPIRDTPIGVIIHGEPGIGKSGLIHFVCCVYSEVKGRKFDPRHMYTRNVDSDYWEEYVPISHDILYYPEVGSLHVKLAQAGLEKAISELTRVIDSGRFPCNMAEANKKGKVFLSSGLVIIDTNKEDLNLQYIRCNPAAYKRRFLYIEPCVKELLKKPGTNMLDPRAGADLRTYDKWTFNVKLMDAVDCTSSKPIYLLQEGDIDELYGTLSKYFTEKIALEKAVSEKRKNAFYEDGYVKKLKPCASEVKEDEMKVLEAQAVVAESEDISTRHKFLQDCKKLGTDVLNVGDLLGSAIISRVYAVSLSTLLKIGWNNGSKRMISIDQWFIPKFLGIWLTALFFGVNSPILALIASVFSVRATLVNLFGYGIETRALEARSESESSWQALKTYLGFEKVSYTLPKHTSTFMCVLGFLFLFKKGIPWITEMIFGKDVESEAATGFKRMSDADLNDELNRRETSHHAGKATYKLDSKLMSNPGWNQVLLPYPASYKGEDPMPLQVKYATNIRESRVLYSDGSFRRTYVFGVKGNAAIINTHALGNEDVVRVDVCSKAGSFKGDSNMFSSLISRKHRVDLGGDVTVIFLSGVSFKDCIVHIAGNDVLLGRPKALLNDIPLRCRKEQRKQVVKDSKFKTTYVLVNPITYEFPEHKSGCCGLPLWVQPNTWALYGIHSGGTAGDSLSYAATFTRSQIEEAISLLASRGLMEVYSQSEFHERVNLTTPNPKSPVYFQDISGLNYYGKDANKRTEVNLKSKVKQTCLTRDNFLSDLFKEVLDFEPDTIYGPPVMKPFFRDGEWFSPWSNGLEKMAAQKSPLDRDILIKCKLEFLTKTLENLKKVGVTERNPWNFETAVNGTPGNPYVRRIDASKSGGYGWPGAKSKHLPIVQDDGVEVIREPTTELKRVMMHTLCAYEQKRRYGVIHTTCLKEEPRDVKKNYLAKTRLFFMSPVDALLMARTVEGPLFNLLVEYHDAFYCAIGIDMHAEAHKIFENLTSFSDEFMEGDYSNYDQRMPFDIGWVTCSYIHDLLRSLGYNEYAMKTLDGVLSDSLYPLVEMLADIYECPGLQTSGKYGTAEENSLRGMFLLMYAWYTLQAEEKIPVGWSFFDYVRPVLYGDDVLAAVKKEAKAYFNNLIYAEFCRTRYAMDYTSAAKDGKLRAFVSTKEMTFLKRRFEYNAHFDRIVAPLSRDSIFKTLQWYVPSSSVSTEMQTISMVQSSLRELMFHCSREQFDIMRSRLIGKLCEHFNIELAELESQMPQFDDLLYAMSISEVVAESENFSPRQLQKQCVSEWYAELKQAEAELDNFPNPMPGVTYHDVRVSHAYHMNVGFRDAYERYNKVAAKVDSLKRSIKSVESGESRRKLRGAVYAESEDWDSKSQSSLGLSYVFQSPELQSSPPTVLGDDTPMLNQLVNNVSGQEFLHRHPVMEDLELTDLLARHLDVESHVLAQHFATGNPMSVNVSSVTPVPFSGEVVARHTPVYQGMTKEEEDKYMTMLCELSIARDHVENALDNTMDAYDDMEFFISAYPEASEMMLNALDSVAKTRTMLQFLRQNMYSVALDADVYHKRHKLLFECLDEITSALGMPREFCNLYTRKYARDEDHFEQFCKLLDIIYNDVWYAIEHFELAKVLKRELSGSEVLSESDDVSNMTTGAAPFRETRENIVDLDGDAETKKDVETRIPHPDLVRTTMPLTYFFERPIELAGFTAAFGSDLNYSVNPWRSFFLSPSVRAKLRNYAYVNCGMVVNVKVSATPFDMGLVLIAYVPHMENNEMGAWNLANLSTGFRPNVIKYLSGTKNCVVMDLKANKPVEMHLELIGFQDKIALMQGTTAISDLTEILDTSRLGQFFVVSLTQFATANPTPSVPSFYIQCNAMTVTLGTITGTNMAVAAESEDFEVFAESKDERETGPIENIASNAGIVSRALEKVPFLAPYAMASSYFFKSLGQLASIFGWSTPQIVADPMLVRPIANENGANCIGARYYKAPTADPKQETHVGPQMGGTSEDELMLAAFYKQPGLLDTFTWSDSTTALTVMWTCAVNPRIAKAYQPVAKKYVQPTPLFFIATPFYWWRGSMTYTIRVACTKFHRGILGISWDPNIVAVVLINSNIVTSKQHLIYMDIQEVQELSFCVKWGFRKPYARVNDDANALACVGSITTPANHKDFANGVVSIFPVTQLQSPDSGSVQVAVWVHSEDMELQVVTNQTLPLSRVMSESEDFELEVFAESEDFGVSQNAVTCVVINPTCSSESNFAATHFGERILSMRFLLRRFVTVSFLNLTSAAAVYGKLRILLSVLPVLLPIFNSTTTALSIQNLFSYLRYCFVGYRGSVVYRIGISNFFTSGPMSRIKANFVFPTTAAISANALTFTAGDYANSHLLGTIEEVMHTNGGFQIRLPYYSPNQFIASGTSTPFNTGDNMQDTFAFKNFEVNVEGMNAAVGTDVRVTVDVAMPDDGTFIGYVGVPAFSI